MSADNGIYILRSPRLNTLGEHNGFEYRVAHCAAIDNLFTAKGAAYRVLLFGRSHVYSEKAWALLEASQLEDNILDQGAILEYGISTIRDTIPFPHMTWEEALKEVGHWREK